MWNIPELKTAEMDLREGKGKWGWLCRREAVGPRL